MLICVERPARFKEKKKDGAVIDPRIVRYKQLFERGGFETAVVKELDSETGFWTFNQTDESYDKNFKREVERITMSHVFSMFDDRSFSNQAERFLGSSAIITYISPEATYTIKYCEQKNDAYQDKRSFAMQRELVLTISPTTGILNEAVISYTSGERKDKSLSFAFRDGSRVDAVLYPFEKAPFVEYETFLEGDLLSELGRVPIGGEIEVSKSGNLIIEPHRGMIRSRLWPYTRGPFTETYMPFEVDLAEFSVAALSNEVSMNGIRHVCPAIVVE